MSNNEGFNRTKKILISITEIAVYYLSIVLSFYIRYKGDIPNFNYSAFESSLIFIMISFLLLNFLFGVYIYYNKSILDFVYLTVIVQFIMTLAIMSVTFFGRWFSFPRSVLGISFLISCILLLISRIGVFKLYEKLSGTKSVMVVGSLERCNNAIMNFEGAKNHRHKIVAAVIDNFYSNIVSNADKVDIIYLASEINNNEKKKIFKFLIDNNKKMFLNTSFENMVMVNPNLMNIEDESIIEISPFSIFPEDAVIKRIIDIIISVLLLIFTSPVILLAAILVKFTSEGPVFYKQVRITKNQKEFNILKFRTMSSTAEKDSGPILASHNDTRVTKIGKYFRSLRIDELPQLINVLKGDMSIVGPRPERPFFVNQFQEANPYYHLRHNVRAGITGYAQVNGKYATDFNSKLNFDLVYIKKYSVLTDTKIMLQTIKILFDKVSSKGLDYNREHADQYKLPKSITVFK